MEQPQYCEYALTFRLAQRRFAVCLKSVTRIVPLLAVTPCEGVADYVVGRVEHDTGELLVIDMSERLGIARDSLYDINVDMMLLRDDAGRSVAFVVDGVGEIIATSDWQQIVPAQRDQGLLAVLLGNETHIPLLDSEALLRMSLQQQQTELNILSLLPGSVV